MAEKEKFEDEEEDDLEYFDWPYNDEEDVDLIEDWDRIDDVDDYQYVDEREE